MRKRFPSSLFAATGCASLVVAAVFLPSAPRLLAQAQRTETTTTTTTESGDAYGLFYEKLNTGGAWLEVEPYGFVWQPDVAGSQRDWRPYTDGYWAQTDAGWTWVSNEDFGWATYHYGRWVRLADRGWVWVPGNEWAPAWVSWRVSNDKKHVGWAPLTPEVRVRRGTEVKGWVDTTYDIGPDYYNFIETRDFGADTYRGHILPVERTTTIITETTNVTTIRYTNVGGREVVYGGGPEVTVIREYSGHPVRELRLETREERGDAFVRSDSRSITRVNGGVLTVLTAPVAAFTATTFAARPHSVRERVTEVRVDRGYGEIRDPAAVERIRAHYRQSAPPAPPEIQNQAAAALRQTRSVTPAGQTAPVGGGGGAASPAPAATAGATPATATSPSGGAGTPAASASPSPTAAATAGGTPTPAASPRGADRPATSPTPAASPAATTAASPTASPTPRGGGRDGRRPGAPASPTPAAGGGASSPASPADSTTPTKGVKGRAQALPGGTPAAEPTITPAAGREGREARKGTKSSGEAAAKPSSSETSASAPTAASPSATDKAERQPRGGGGTKGAERPKPAAPGAGEGSSAATPPKPEGRGERRGPAPSEGSSATQPRESAAAGSGGGGERNPTARREAPAATTGGGAAAGGGATATRPPAGGGSARGGGEGGEKTEKKPARPSPSPGAQ